MSQTCGQLDVVVSRDRAEELCGWIRENWKTEPVQVESPRGGPVVIQVYVDTPFRAEGLIRQLPTGAGILSAHAMACHEKHWSTFWRHHFHVQDIGRRLRTVPAWEKTPDRKRINLRMDPGLSFGTGGHFTTRFCLEQIENAWDCDRPRSMLDAGTGSGILAIAGARLGIARIAAFDHDPVCLARCRHNARLNRLRSDRIRFFTADVLQGGWCRKPADLVCANILTSVLIAAAPALWRATRHRLVLTGIREPEADSVSGAFRSQGAQEVLRDGDAEWCGMVMKRP